MLHFIEKMIKHKHDCPDQAPWLIVFSNILDQKIIETLKQLCKKIEIESFTLQFCDPDLDPEFRAVYLNSRHLFIYPIVVNLNTN